MREPMNRSSAETTWRVAARVVEGAHVGFRGPAERLGQNDPWAALGFPPVVIAAWLSGNPAPP